MLPSSSVSMKCLFAVLLLVQVLNLVHCQDSFKDKTAFYEDFSSGWDKRWVPSEAAKYSGKFELVKPSGWEDHGIKMPARSKHYGMYSSLSAPVDPTKGFVVQYEVKYTDSITCGGAYLKLISDEADLDGASLDNDTPYSIMFGPDKCGVNSKVHLIFKHHNPKTGTISEKHLKNPPSPATDDATHVYTLIVTPDNKFEVLVDGEVKSSGSLLGDEFDPKFTLPETIPDPTDTKPEDWVDDAKIPDPDATKPDDWVEEKEIDDPKDKKPAAWQDDEPEVIPDPAAKKPEDWDDEEDGDWTPPDIPNPKCKKAGCGVWTPKRIPNPAYKGPWKAPLIDNPAYKGPWIQKTIPNPEHYVETKPLTNIGKISAVAFELWTIDQGYTFDNILIATDAAVAKEARNTLWKPRVEAEKKFLKKEDTENESQDEGLAQVIINAFNEEPLSKYKHLVAPFLKFLEKNEWAAWVLALSPVVLLILGVFTCLVSGGGKKPVDEVGLRKKDLLPEDDKEEDDQPAEPATTAATAANADEDEDTNAPEPSVVTTRTAAKSTKTAKTGEIVDADEDDEDDAKGPRRRRA